MIARICERFSPSQTADLTATAEPELKLNGIKKQSAAGHETKRSEKSLGTKKPKQSLIHIPQPNVWR
jgi:hypothetical protein